MLGFEFFQSKLDNLRVLLRRIDRTTVRTLET